MNSELYEFLDQVRECDQIIQEQEELREALYKRIDKIQEVEGEEIL